MGEEPESPSGIRRRTLLTTGAAAAIVGAGVGAAGVALLGTPGRGPSLWTRPDQSGAQPVGGLHLQFGKDASTEVVVSWHTTDPVRNPRVMVGTPTSGFGRVVQAETRTYRDAISKTEVRVSSRRHQSRARDGPDRPVRAKTVALHKFRRSGHLDTGPIQKPDLRHPQPWIAGGRRYHDRHRTFRTALQPRQRRPVLRQPRQRPHSHLVGLVRQQHALGALPAMDARGKQP